MTNSYTWTLAHNRLLELGAAPRLMGILNVTPDSFSDGGRYRDVDAAVKQAEQLIKEGADIIDVGGESTRPGAEAVDEKEEMQRVLPVIEALSAKSDILISIDTYRSGTAKAAVSAGAHIINDVFGAQKDNEIAHVAAETGAGLVLMHTGRERKKLPDVLEDQIDFFSDSLAISRKAGVAPSQIVFDPGFGFAKNTDENLELLGGISQLCQLGFPVLIGTSRKRFLGEISEQSEAEGRDLLTAVSGVLARMAGAHIFRVHNVAAQSEALKFLHEVRNAKFV